MRAAGTWLSRLLSTVIVVYVGYKIVMTYSFVLNTTADRMLSGE